MPQNRQREPQFGIAEELCRRGPLNTI